MSQAFLTHGTILAASPEDAARLVEEIRLAGGTAEGRPGPGQLATVEFNGQGKIAVSLADGPLAPCRVFPCRVSEPALTEEGWVQRVEVQVDGVWWTNEPPPLVADNDGPIPAPAVVFGSAIMPAVDDQVAAMQAIASAAAAFARDLVDDAESKAIADASPISLAEVTELMAAIREQRVTLTIDGDRTWQDTYAGDVPFRTSHGWTLVVFNDCDDWDYIDHIEAPDGRRIDYDPHIAAMGRLTSAVWANEEGEQELYKQAPLGPDWARKVDSTGHNWLRGLEKREDQIGEKARTLGQALGHEARASMRTMGLAGAAGSSSTLETVQRLLDAHLPVHADVTVNGGGVFRARIGTLEYTCAPATGVGPEAIVDALVGIIRSDAHTRENGPPNRLGPPSTNLTDEEALAANDGLAKSKRTTAGY